MIQFHFRFQVYAPKNKKQGLKQILRRPLFTVALFTIAKRQKQPEGPPQMNGSAKCGLHIQWDITQPLQEEHSGTLHNTDEPGEHYAKWNNPDPKGQILYDFTYVK